MLYKKNLLVQIGMLSSLIGIVAREVLMPPSHTKAAPAIGALCQTEPRKYADLPHEITEEIGHDMAQPDGYEYRLIAGGQFVLQSSQICPGPGIDDLARHAVVPDVLRQKVSTERAKVHYWPIDSVRENVQVGLPIGACLTDSEGRCIVKHGIWIDIERLRLTPGRYGIDVPSELPVDFMHELLPCVQRIVRYSFGVKEGLCSGYWPEGTPEISGEYRDGKRVGSWIGYDRFGRFDMLEYWSDGLRNGMHLRRTIAGQDTSGSQLFICECKNGVLEGRSLQVNEKTGFLLLDQNFHHDQLSGWRRRWDLEGRLVSEKWIEANSEDGK